jgi:hypothetical protein
MDSSREFLRTHVIKDGTFQSGIKLNRQFSAAKQPICYLLFVIAPQVASGLGLGSSGRYS